MHRDTWCPLLGLLGYLMGAKDRGIGFAVFRGKENITADQLGEPVGNDDIRIAPILMGSKNGGVFSIVLGVVLVAAGLYFHIPFLVQAGASMILGSVVQLLTPIPKGSAANTAANSPSYVFNGAVNTQAQGNPVPLLHGRMIVGSAVISAGINAEDYSPVTAGVGSGYAGGYRRAPDAGDESGAHGRTDHALWPTRLVL